MVSQSFVILLFSTLILLFVGIGLRRLGFPGISNFCLILSFIVTLFASASIGIESNI